MCLAWLDLEVRFVTKGFHNVLFGFLLARLEKGTRFLTL